MTRSNPLTTPGELSPLFRAPPATAELGIYRAIHEPPQLPLAQRSNFWRLTAWLYEPLWRRRSVSLLTRGEFSVTRELALMLQWLRPQPNQLILDAGTSSGLYSRTLLKYQPSLIVHAIDLSLPFLRRAARYAEKDGLNYILLQADACALPYRDGIFDAVVCGGSLNEFLDPQQALNEFGRVLKPGGRMWQMYIRSAGSRSGRLSQALFRLSGLRFFTPPELTYMAEEAQLTMVKAQYHGPVALALFEKRVPELPRSVTLES